MHDKIFYEAKLFSSRNYKSEAEALDNIFRSLHISRNSSILDIGSNRGIHAALLSKMGYKVTGIDLNPKFINYSKKSVKAAKFLLADMRIFHSEQPFNAAIAILNGIYFNKTKKELSKAFKSIFNNLKPGGVLIFDINTNLLKDHFVNNRKGVIGYSEKKIQVARFESIRKVKDKVLLKLTYLVRDHSQFYSYSNLIRFGFFSIAELKGIAKKSGFKSFKILKFKNFRPKATCFICIK